MVDLYNGLTLDERVAESNREWRERNKSLGFWKDMQEYFSQKNTSIQTYNNSGGNLPPRGCRGCFEDKKAWWCPIFNMCVFPLLIPKILIVILEVVYSIIEDKVRKLL
jgi:hypothetical protein